MNRRPPRLPARDYIGPAIGFLTFCVHDRRPTLADDRISAGVMREFRHATTRHDVALIAYCLMPDHAHLLGQVTHGSIAQWASACKQRTAYIARRYDIARLWQAGYFDRMLRHEDNVIDVAAYILANPVRARLTTEIGDYPWAGSDVYSIADLKSAMQVRPRWW